MAGRVIMLRPTGGIGPAIPFTGDEGTALLAEIDALPATCLAEAELSRDGHRWYAILRWPPPRWESTPDFSTCADTREAAIALCALKIRLDICGDLTSHLPQFGYYDLVYRLAPFWRALAIQTTEAT